MSNKNLMVNIIIIQKEIIKDQYLYLHMQISKKTIIINHQIFQIMIFVRKNYK